MKINEIRYDVLCSALNVFCWEKNFKIYAMNGNPFRKKKPYIFGVNWSATGTQDAETTRAFAKSLLKATEIVDKLDELKLELVWDAEDEFIKTKEAYQYSVQTLAKAIEAGEYKLLEDFLIAGVVED